MKRIGAERDTFAHGERGISMGIRPTSSQTPTDACANCGAETLRMVLRFIPGTRRKVCRACFKREKS